MAKQGFLRNKKVLEQSSYEGYCKMQRPGILLTKRSHRTRKKYISSEYISGVPGIAVMDGWEDRW